LPAVNVKGISTKAALQFDPYAKAKASLYKSVGEPLTGRAIALANQTEDRSIAVFILFSIPKITITADVVEFTDVAPGGNATPK
jgi:hypothetical protein